MDRSGQRWLIRLHHHHQGKQAVQQAVLLVQSVTGDLWIANFDWAEDSLVLLYKMAGLNHRWTDGVCHNHTDCNLRFAETVGIEHGLKYCFDGTQIYAYIIRNTCMHLKYVHSVRYFQFQRWRTIVCNLTSIP